ncbi:hypothetical protein BJX66DRAFT_60496 [Aspergillus keveii]|uniref:Nephrocystin 3-like N-terminal domain-containing protein n=1 Tax=Aspergillus keveii TaxID=714993 RepID=A0ABR4FQX3_9EURO
MSPLQVQMDKMLDAVSEARDEAKPSKQIPIITRTFATAADGEQKNIMKDTPLAENVCLRASFFFERTKPDRNNTKRLFLTLARQLADALPDFKDLLCQATKDNHNVSDQSSRDQWRNLILEPLSRLEKRILSSITLVIVINAMFSVLMTTEAHTETQQPGLIFLWDRLNGQSLGHFQYDYRASPYETAFSPDRTLLALAPGTGLRRRHSLGSMRDNYIESSRSGP